MLDKNGYRPNVGIVLLNHGDQVWWGRRFHHTWWQFPQGGLQSGESLQQAMYRELQEEVGLLPEHVRIIGHTPHWLYYDVPLNLRRSNAYQRYQRCFKGQKQIWFFLRFLGLSSDVRVNTTNEPEFDAWCWADFWQPVYHVVSFKRLIYKQVMHQLSERITDGK